jgi:Zn-dependent protease with chaperone function
VHSAGSPLPATYFDGRSARAQAVTLRLLGEGRQRSLHIEGEGIAVQVPARQVQWPERTRHGMRLAQLPGGGHVQCEDSAAWDAWVQSQGLGESLVVKMQQSWRWVAGSVALLLCLAVAMQLWGLPVVARAVVAVTPTHVDQAIGEKTLEAIDQLLMAPSQLPASQQDAIRQAFAQATAQLGPRQPPPWQLVFRKSKIGPNALALPGGTIILTDEMVALVDGDTRVLTAVLGHELGHVQHRHGVRMLVQATVLGTLGAVVLGDFSSLLAAVPALLGQAHYSRTAEREADAYAVQVLKAAGLSPLHMVRMFEALERQRQTERDQRRAERKNGDADAKTTTADDTEDVADDDSGSWLGIAFASHPSDADRIAFFKAAAL